jgi:hypothetical protein
MRRSIPDPLAKRLGSRRRAHARLEAQARTPDPAVLRARHAGGPVDCASYTCQCGCTFLAPVSTTVACPHCQAPQAW